MSSTYNKSKRRFRIDFTIEMDCWSSEDIKDFALQELECMSPFPENILFSEVWSTGTPTEDGWYLVTTRLGIYGVAWWYTKINRFGGTSSIESDDIVAWQKIEPFEEDKG